jgi:hypothetical protein
VLAPNICFRNKLFSVAMEDRFSAGIGGIASMERKDQDLAYSVSHILPTFDSAMARENVFSAKGRNNFWSRSWRLFAEDLS